MADVLLLEPKQGTGSDQPGKDSPCFCCYRIFCRHLFRVRLQGTMSFSCYCLVNPEGRTYVGFSTNVDRRLRQHNGELVGGARATKGSEWTRLCVVTGFPTQQSALQFEWKWKHLSRKARGNSAVERRCAALLCLLNAEQSTSNAVPFSTYEQPLLVLVEDSRILGEFKDKEMLYGILVE